MKPEAFSCWFCYLAVNSYEPRLLTPCPFIIVLFKGLNIFSVTANNLQCLFLTVSPCTHQSISLCPCLRAG